MNRLIFEGRFLVNMSGSIMRQDALHPVRGRLDWERMFRIADYNRIANLAYLGLLGNGAKVPERWRDHFFERYQEALRFGESCEEGEKEILTLLDMREVSCIVLGSSSLRNLYQIPEASANHSLRLFLDSENYSLAKGYLIDLGYETDNFYPGFGEHMKRISGFSVEIYHKLPFDLTSYEKSIRKLLERASLANEYSHIRVLSVDDSFIFMAAQVAYHYVQDELLIRELLDLYLCHRAWSDRLNEEYIVDRLTNLKVEELVYKLLYISYMWFGNKVDIGFESPAEDMIEYDVLENRILSRGVIKKETDAQAIALSQAIHMEKVKEKRRAKVASFKKHVRDCWKVFKRKLDWIFPEYKYMCTVYPVLEKVPVLLPLFWLVRGIRFLRQ